MMMVKKNKKKEQEESETNVQNNVLEESYETKRVLKNSFSSRSMFYNKITLFCSCPLYMDDYGLYKLSFH